MNQSGPFNFAVLNIQPPTIMSKTVPDAPPTTAFLVLNKQVQTPNEEVPGWLRVCPIYPLHNTERPREMSQLHKQTRSLLDKKKEVQSKKDKETSETNPRGHLFPS